ncbi:hypothetical protein EC604_28960 [Paenibacillus amylolyticus]|uniref:ParB-like N-terminal domain-containing protein n=1 Tax=Paenibacillus amylolyticus TaxID=1451 RepID=A0A5M9X1S2_PAEAM|nr:ParB/RepB/Spo0J family partition protein [Paenibacillus amylolyticus]KAA8787857.1 hypothetical protein EC604_28960 [Paenibacillus amylolyticus]
MRYEDRIEIWSVVDLKDHPENSKYNSELSMREEASLKASIAEVGIQEPLLIRPDGTVLSGHQRKRIATSIGLAKVPVRQVHCSEEEAVYLLVTTNEARRGDEKDLMKKARRVQVLYEAWGIKPGRKRVQDAHFDRHDVASVLQLDDSSLRRLLKLLYLIPEFQQEVSKGRIGLVAGNKIASLDREQQNELFRTFQVAGEIKTATIIKMVDQLRDEDTGPDLKDVRREQKQKQVQGKLDKLKKDLIWFITEPDSEEERAAVAGLLDEYLGYMRGEKRG